MTLRLECVLHAATPPLPDEAAVALRGHHPPRPHRLARGHRGRRPHHAAVLRRPRRILQRRLTAYPEDLLAAPLRVTSATLAVDPSGGPAGPPPPVEGGVPAPTGLGAITDAFTDLVARQQLTVPFALLAVAIALGVGAPARRRPGPRQDRDGRLPRRRPRPHPRRPRPRAASSRRPTPIGVLLLGLAISLSGTLAPEHLYRPLGLLSGALFVVLGITLLRRSVRNPAHTHTHGPGGHHHHEDHAEHHEVAGGHGAVATLVRPVAPPAHDHHHHDHHDAPRLGWRGMVLPGLAGGMVPTPVRAARAAGRDRARPGLVRGGAGAGVRDRDGRRAGRRGLAAAARPRPPRPPRPPRAGACSRAPRPPSRWSPPRAVILAGLVVIGRAALA